MELATQSQMGFESITGIDKGMLADRGAAMVQLGPGDDQQVVIFRWESVRDDIKSREAGRPIYTRAMYVTIHPPGERLNIIDRPVMESDKQRWPRQWAAFCQNRAHVPEGTPIAMLFPVNPEVADMLRGLGIHTVELCARISPHGIDTIGMGAQEWVNRAKDYLEKSKKGVEYHQIEQMKVTHKNEVNALQNQIADLTMRLNNLQQSMLTHGSPHMAAAIGHEQRIAATPAQPPLPPPEKWAAPAAGLLEGDAEASEAQTAAEVTQPRSKSRGRNRDQVMFTEE